MKHSFDNTRAKWNSYDWMYIEYALANSQIQMLSFLLQILIEDFPKNMPRDLFAPILAKYDAFWVNEMKKRGMSVEVHEIFKEFVDVELTEKMKKLYYCYVSVHQVSSLFKNMPYSEYPDFNRICLSQEIITAYALTEGFVTDSVRTICKVKPEVLKKEKVVTWKEVLEVKDKNELIEKLAENFVHDEFDGNLNDKIGKINHHFSLKLSLTEEQQQKLEELVIIRNLIVHNNGKANKKYVDLYGKGKLKVGEDIPLAGDYVEMLVDTLTEINHEIYKIISKKFFGQSEEHLVFNPEKAEKTEFAL